jgi:hypothetical protein
MRQDRRDALRLGATALAPLGAGCVSREGGRRPESDDGRDGAATATGRATDETETPRADHETTTTRSVPTTNPALAERTTRAVEEIEWLATEYPAAIDTTQAAMQRARASVLGLRAESEISLGEANLLRRQLDRRVDEVEQVLSPHFGFHNTLRRRLSGFTGTVVRFARRGDDDRTKEELDRLASYLRALTGDRFYEDSLPRQPVHNIVVRQLRGGEFDEDVPMLFQVRHVPSGYDAYAYETRPAVPTPYDLSRPAVSADDERRVLRAFTPLRVRRGRRRETLVAFDEGNPSSRLAFDTRDPGVGTDQTVYVQTYENERAAWRAERLTAARVAADEFGRRQTAIGDSAWSRVYYTGGGDVWYAYLTRAGSHLLATGAARTAWEERVDWGLIHDRTWLATN